MDLSKQNILFLLRGTQHGGTENVVNHLCTSLFSKVNKIIVCSADGFDVSFINSMGIKHYVISDINDKSLKNILVLLKKIMRIVKYENITVIHTHHRAAAFYMQFFSIGKRFILVNTSHNSFTNKRLLTRFVYKRANLIACGQMVKKNLVDYYRLSEDKITVIPNAVGTFCEEIQPIEFLLRLRNAGSIFVGNVGRLSEQKGMKYFLESLPSVKQYVPNVKYVIIGDGEDKRKLELLSEKLKIKNDVIFMGYRIDVRNVMIQMDFLVLSSLWEGLPLTPIEAFSVGKTLVATAIDGTTEIVKDGINGFLVPPRDSNSLASPDE